MHTDQTYYNHTHKYSQQVQKCSRLFLIRLAFNKLKTFESELVVIDGGSLKFSIPISIMALCGRNISLALRPMYTVALIFSVCTWFVCVCMLGGRNKRGKRAQGKWQCHFKSKINKEILILSVYDKQVPQSLCRSSAVLCVVVTTV